MRASEHEGGREFLVVFTPLPLENDYLVVYDVFSENLTFISVRSRWFPMKTIF